MAKVYVNDGYPPSTDKKLRIRWQNGQVSRHTYLAKQLRWSLTGSEWDILRAMEEEG